MADNSGGSGSRRDDAAPASGTETRDYADYYTYEPTTTTTAPSTRRTSAASSVGMSNPHRSPEGQQQQQQQEQSSYASMQASTTSVQSAIDANSSTRRPRPRADYGMCTPTL